MEASRCRAICKCWSGHRGHAIKWHSIQMFITALRCLSNEQCVPGPIYACT